MNFPVLIHPTTDGFSASLIGAPEVQAMASSREAALAGLCVAIEKRVACGELLTLQVGDTSLHSIAGSYRDDPFLLEISQEAARRRAEEPRE